MNEVHPPGCQCGKYACELRSKSVQISAAATPTSHNRKAPAPHTNNQWEKQKAGEHRAGGTFMPYIDQHRNTIPIKSYTDKKAVHQESRRRQHERAIAAGGTH